MYHHSSAHLLRYTSFIWTAPLSHTVPVIQKSLTVVTECIHILSNMFTFQQYYIILNVQSTNTNKVLNLIKSAS